MATLTADALAGFGSPEQANELNWNAVVTGTGEALGGYVFHANKIAADNFTGGRTLLWFNTSSLTQNAIIESAKIVHPVISTSSNANSVTMHLVTHTAPSTTIVTGDYDSGIGSTSFGSVAMSSLSAVTTTDISLNASGIAAINKTGNTAIAIISNLDKDNTAPTGYNEYVSDRSLFDLVVTYTLQSGSLLFV